MSAPVWLDPLLGRGVAAGESLHIDMGRRRHRPLFPPNADAVVAARTTTCFVCSPVHQGNILCPASAYLAAGRAFVRARSTVAAKGERRRRPHLAEVSGSSCAPCGGGGGTARGSQGVRPKPEVPTPKGAASNARRGCPQARIWPSLYTLRVQLFI